MLRSALSIIFLCAAAHGFLQPGFGVPKSMELAMARGPPRRRPIGRVIRDDPPMNSEITQKELRVVTPTSGGKDLALGIMSLAEAMAKAKEMGGLDVILVNAQSDPVVCKIADYSKYRYMLEKNAKEKKKNSKATEVKEVKMSYKIGIGDYDVRKKNAWKFIQQGNRVKCTVTFRGREVQHDKLGFELLDKLAAELEDVCVKEGRPKREGRNLFLILGPRVDVLKAVNERRRAQEKNKKKAKKEAFDERLAKIAAGLEVDDEEFDDDDDDDDDYEDDDDDDDMSLDDLLGSDKVVDDLFSSKK
jgi:translation initiation factor IF-3